MAPNSLAQAGNAQAQTGEAKQQSPAEPPSETKESSDGSNKNNEKSGEQASEQSSKDKPQTTNAGPSSISRANKNPHQTLIKQLQASYRTEELVRLKADGKAFSALWRQERKGKAFGAVLIVPADGQTPNWPHSIDVLRQDLSLSGWSTLAIETALMPSPKVPARPTAAEPKAAKQTANTSPQGSDNTQENSADTTNTTEAPAARKNNIESSELNSQTLSDTSMLRIDSAFDYLHEQGQFNIVLIGYGNSAKRVLDFVRDNRDQPDRAVRALVLVQAQAHNGGPLAPEFRRFDSLSLPLLDVYFDLHELDRREAAARKNAAREQRFDAYEQLKLREPDYEIFANENQLSRRVKGFLNRKAKGVEIGRR